MLETPEVLVVGAGPVGLLLAAELCRHGVGCRVIDKRPQAMTWVKALGVSQRTLEVWDDLGLVNETLDAGLILRRQQVFISGRQVADGDTAFPDEAPFRYPLLLPQPETERLLTAHLTQFGVAVERGVELTTFADGADGVAVTLATPGGTETARYRYLVGCDGAHSVVRHGLQLPFEGGQFPATFLLADVEIEWEYGHESLCLFLQTQGEALENVLVCVPYRDPADPKSPRYRISTMARPVTATDWEAGSSATPEEETSALTLDQVQELVARYAPVPAAVRDLRWSSVFRISHRIVPRYRVGRVFLAGDAAHIHPPTGGQGMNTGLQDAYNLAWKLALDVRGLAHSQFLDSYNAERQPVGRAVVERTVQRTVSIADRTDPAQALRDDSQLCVHYRDSAWVCEKLSQPGALAGGPRPGDRAPDAWGLCRVGVDVPSRLFDLFRGTHHTLLWTGKEAGWSDSLPARCGNELRVYRIADPSAGEERGGDCRVVLDVDGHFRRAYGVTGPCAYLIRPDGYVGFRTDVLSREVFDDYLKDIFLFR
jgi:2-polyprenyl-6-methoxyphenol hydroxylase-like FAD-dependent oxidoreductase